MMIVRPLLRRCAALSLILLLAGALATSAQPNDAVLRAQLFLDGSAFKPERSMENGASSCVRR